MSSPAIRRILCPVDFSESSDRAFARAREIARRFGAELQALYVWESTPQIPTEATAWAGRTPEPAPRLLLSGAALRMASDAMRKLLESTNHDDRVTAQIDCGHPSTVIVDLAERQGFDLIVMGTHGRSGFRRYVLGSVAEAVMRNAACPVLVVPASASIPPSSSESESNNDAEAREDLALTSLFGGLALANAKLGAVHGFAGPLGGLFHGPHGAICARLLPLVMEANIAALRARAPRSPVLARYADVARLLTGNPNAATDDGPPWVLDLVERMSIPRLGVYGMSGGDVTNVVDKAKRASSMQGNPIELTDDELAGLLERAL